MFLKVVAFAFAGFTFLSGACAQEFLVSPLYTLEGASPSLSEVLDLSAQFNDRVLQTVFWSLGLVVTVLTFLMGVNWFVGNRTFERDRETFQLMIKSELETLDRRQAAQLSAAISDTRKELQDQYQALLETQSERLSNAELEQSKLAEKLKSDFDGQIRMIEKNFLDALMTMQNSLDREMKYANMNYHELDAFRWKQQGVPVNEIFSRAKYSMGLLQLKFSLGLVSTQVGLILRLLEESPPGHAKTEIQQLIEMLPETLSIERGKLSEALAKSN